MNIYNFFNSPDVEEHCKSINHTFNTLECAVIINKSTKPLQEKHKAYKALIAKFPDMIFQTEEHKKQVSLHEALKVIINYREKLLERYLMSEPGVIYQSAIFKRDSQESEDTDRYLVTSFDSAYENAVQSLGSNHLPFITIKKSYPDSWKSIEAKVTWQGDVISLSHYNSESSDLDEPPEYSILDTYIIVPTPFTDGDLVESDKGVYVLHNANRDKHPPYYNELLRSGEPGNDNFRGNDGLLLRHNTSFYPDLRYCRRRLTGDARILKYISLYIKGKISIDSLLQAQMKLTLDKLAEGLQNYHISRKFEEMGDNLFESGKNIIDGVEFNKDMTSLVKASKDITGKYTMPEGVETIENYAFEHCNKLTVVTIPDSVKEIGWRAFGSCASLTQVVLSEGLLTIGSEAFAYCSSLKNIKIPKSVRFIHNEAFDRCVSLVSLTLPAGVLDISYMTFDGCKSLTVINVDKNNRRFADIDGVLFNKDITTLIKYPEGKENSDYTVPESVTSFEHGAFYFVESLKKVTLPSAMKSLHYYAFQGCKSLAEVNIPAGVINVDKGAFISCRAIENIYVSEKNEIYSHIDGVLFTKDKETLVKFPSGRKGTYIVPEGVLKIGSQAFDDCGLTTVELPDSLTEIKAHAFRSCKFLVDITIPDNGNLKEISPGFYMCESLSNTTKERIQNITGMKFDKFNSLA